MSKVTHVEKQSRIFDIKYVESLPDRGRNTYTYIAFFFEDSIPYVPCSKRLTALIEKITGLKSPSQKLIDFLQEKFVKQESTAKDFLNFIKDCEPDCSYSLLVTEAEEDEEGEMPFTTSYKWLSIMGGPCATVVWNGH